MRQGTLVGGLLRLRTGNVSITVFAAARGRRARCLGGRKLFVEVIPGLSLYTYVVSGATV